MVTREYELHDSPISGMLWLTPSVLLVFACGGGGKGGGGGNGGVGAGNDASGGNGGGAGGGSGGGGGGGGGSYHNTIHVIDISSGSVRDLAPSKGAESHALCGLRLSPTGRRLLLLYKDGPPRLLDLSSGRYIASQVLPTLPLASATEWMPPRPAESASAATPRSDDCSAEALLLAIPDGSTLVLSIRSSRIVATRGPAATQPEVAPGLVTALAIGGPWVASGSVEGAICLWHRDEPDAGHLIATHRGLVRALVFDGGAPVDRSGAVPSAATAGASTPTPTQLLALFGNGELAVWVLPTRAPWLLPPAVSSGRPLPGSRALAACFTHNGQPVAAFEGGVLSLLRRDLASVNVPVSSQRSLPHPKCTALLPRRAHAQLLTQLMHAAPPEDRGATRPATDGPSSTAAFVHPRVAEWLPRQSLRRLCRPMALPERCAAISLELGLGTDWRFWCIVTAKLADAEKPEDAAPASPGGRTMVRSGTALVSTAAAPAAGSMGASDAVGQHTAAAASVASSNTAMRDAAPDLWATFGVLRSSLAVRRDRLARLAEQMAAAAASAAPSSLWRQTALQVLCATLNITTALTRALFVVLGM